MIPSSRLVLLAVVPVVLALTALLDDSLVWPMLAADAALALVAAIDALLGRRVAIEITRSAPSVFSIGRKNIVTLEVRSRARRPLVVQVTDDVFADSERVGLPAIVKLMPGQRVRIAYEVRPSRRGDHILGDHHVRASTPLGLFFRQRRIPASDRVRVYPDVQAVRSFELLARQDRQAALRQTRLRGGESEFERLRDFTQDDEFRRIDWRATARRQKLTARDYQLERNQSILFALDCGRLMTAEIGGMSRLDHALNATLMMSHVATRTGDHVGLLAFDERVTSYLPVAAAAVGGKRGSARVIGATYDLEARMVDSNFGRALDEISARVRKRSLVVLFTHVIDERGADEVARFARGLYPRHLPLVILFREEEIERLLRPEAGDAPTDMYTRAAAAEMSTRRRGLLRDLQSRGVLTLDTNYRQLTPKLVERYLDVKARQLL